MLLQCGAHTDDIQKCLALLSPTFRDVVQPRATLFIVGEREAGKSTITAALQVEKGGISRLVARLVKVCGVKEKTAGIETRLVDSLRIGNLIIYDLSGHDGYLNAHDTVIKSIMSMPTSAMFLLHVKLTNSMQDLRQTTLSWLSFLENQVVSGTSYSTKSASLLAIGSHVDLVTSRRDLQEKQVLLEGLCKSASKLHFLGVLAINCQHSESPALTQVRRHIFNFQESQGKMTFHLHCLHVFLVSVCEDQPGIHLGEVMQKMGMKKYETEVSFFLYYLSQDIQAMIKACVQLTKRGIILFLQRDPAEDSLVIIEREPLLQQVIGTVFAPDDFYEHKLLVIHSGVVPLTKICECFKNLDGTKHIHSELIVQFLCQMEYCKEMKDTKMLDMLAIQYHESEKERYFLFPALITEKFEDLTKFDIHSTEDLWVHSPNTTYSWCSWILQCHGEGEYLTLRFQQVLLLRLFFTQMATSKVHEASPTLPQACTLWKNGIKWNTTSALEALVKFNDLQVMLLLRCKNGEEKPLKCLQSEVMKKVLTAKEEFCCNTVTTEQFVPSLNEPMNITITGNYPKETFV